MPYTLWSTFIVKVHICNFLRSSRTSKIFKGGPKLSRQTIHDLSRNLPLRYFSDKTPRKHPTDLCKKFKNQNGKILDFFTEGYWKELGINTYNIYNGRI